MFYDQNGQRGTKHIKEIILCYLPQWLQIEGEMREREMNAFKRAWFVCRGFFPNMSQKQLNDAWTTWSFQINFMFNPVL